jgi:hypothetical protein
LIAFVHSIAQVALLPFKMSKNVVLEEVTVQTGAWCHVPRCQRGCCTAAAAGISMHLTRCGATFMYLSMLYARSAGKTPKKPKK